MKRSEVVPHILSLDPVKDHVEIVRLTTFFEFPIPTERALQFALFRTFAVPTIGELLDATKEFEYRPQKRYDDTDLILSEIMEHGYDSERGLAAIRRMNNIHKHFNISNDDYLYVLSTFVVEPVRWLNRYGYRNTTNHEKIAGMAYWKVLGKLMGIKNIPDNYEELEAYNIKYENERFTYHAGSRRVADSTVNMFLSWYLPKWLYWMGRPFIIGIMDEPLRRAFGYKKPLAIFGCISHAALWTEGHLRKWKPLPKQPYLRTKLKRETYPSGYDTKTLGPEKAAIADKYLRK